MIGVRPERVTIGDAAQACENHFDATIEEVFFLGQGYKVIAKADGVNWTIVSQNRLSLPSLVVGEQISVGFDAEDIILICD
jgi:ABC-type Fe3+/spermidine/putrescine transport system ATPase subunit